MSCPLVGSNLGAGIVATVLSPESDLGKGVSYTLSITTPDSGSQSKVFGSSYTFTVQVHVGGGTQNVTLEWSFEESGSALNWNVIDAAAEVQADNPTWSVTDGDVGLYKTITMTRTLAPGSYTITMPFAPAYDGIGDYDVGGPYAVSAQVSSVQYGVASPYVLYALTVTAPAPTVFNIAKTAGVNGAYDATAYTNQSYTGDVEVEFKVELTGDALAFGLSADNPDANYTGIDYAAINDSGTFFKSLNGTLTNVGSLVANDVVKIARVISTGVVTFYKNGVSVSTATGATGTLLVDSSFRFSGDTALSVKVTVAGVAQAVTWTTTNCTVTPL